MTTSCLLCGVGGQGTVLASKLVAFAAMADGKDVRTAETIGMAQRGGCVVSHVRIGKDIASPLIPKGAADCILAFEPAEAVRCLDYLKIGGTVVVNQKAVKPVTSSLSNSPYNGGDMLQFLQETIPSLAVVDGDTICCQCGTSKVLNVALLAAAAQAGVLGITLVQLEQAIRHMVPERFWKPNLLAIELVCTSLDHVERERMDG